MNRDLSDGLTAEPKTERPPGVCLPWEEVRARLPEITGDPELFKRVWQEVDQLPYLYIWYCLLAF